MIKKEEENILSSILQLKTATKLIPEESTPTRHVPIVLLQCLFFFTKGTLVNVAQVSTAAAIEAENLS